MDIETSIHIQANLTSQEYRDVISSLDRVYAAYLHHFPHNIDEIAPLMAFKNAMVLSAQECLKD